MDLDDCSVKFGSTCVWEIFRLPIVELFMIFSKYYFYNIDGRFNCEFAVDKMSSKRVNKITIVAVFFGV